MSPIRKHFTYQFILLSGITAKMPLGLPQWLHNHSVSSIFPWLISPLFLSLIMNCLLVSRCVMFLLPFCFLPVGFRTHAAVQRAIAPGQLPCGSPSAFLLFFSQALAHLSTFHCSSGPSWACSWYNQASVHFRRRRWHVQVPVSVVSVPCAFSLSPVTLSRYFRSLLGNYRV